MMIQVVLLVFCVVYTQAYHVISSGETQLVLDASQKIIKLQEFDDTLFQKWLFESIGYGKYYVINAKDGTALTVQDVDANGSFVTVKPKNCTTSQQWYINHDKTISNPVHKYVVDVWNNTATAGAYLSISKRNKKRLQEFRIYCAKSSKGSN